MRNNSVYFAKSNDASRGVVVNDQGSNHVIASNLIYFGAGSQAGAACMESNLSTGAFSGWDNNLCYGTSWTSQYATRAAFTSATGFDANGVSADPKFAAVPSLSNNFSLALASGSPAINTGSTSLSSAIDRLSLSRSAPDIGAFEFAASGSTNAPPAPPTNVVVQ